MSSFPENDHSVLNKSMLYQTLLDENNALKNEVQRLSARLGEPEELQRAISEGDLDALVISKQEEKIFILDNADSAYHTLVEIANEDMVILDANFNITYVGERLLYKTGYSREEVIDKPWIHFVDKEYKNFVDQRLKERRQGVFGNYEVKLINRDGLPYWVIVSAKPLFDDNGKFKGSLGMLTDITKRKQDEMVLQEAYENIQIQAEELQVQSEELQMQNEDLHTQSEELREAYETLHENEEHYRMLFANMTDAFFLAESIYDKNDKPCNYKFLEVNPAYEHMMNITSEQLLGKSLLEVYPKTSQQTIQKYNEVAVSGQPAHFEVFSHVANNKYFDVYAFSPEKGKLAVILSDITKRKNIEVALQESEAKALHLIKYAPAGIYEIDFSVPKYINVNDVFCQMSGYTREELLNIHPLELMVDKSKDKFVERIKKINDGQEVSSQEEYFVVGKYGQKLWVLINAKFTYKDNKVVGATVVAHDITERKRAEEAMRLSEEKYRNIVETANEGIFVFDSDIRVTYANNKIAEMLGYSPEEMIGKYGTDFVDEEYKIYTEIRKEKRLQGIDEVHENKFVHKNGSTLWMLVNSKSFFDKDGKFTGILAMLTDITKIKEAEKALQKAHDSLEEKVKERTAELEVACWSLEESESNLAEAQRISHIGSWEWDILSNKTYCSDEMYRIFGVSDKSQNTSFDTILSYIHPEDQVNVNTTINNALTGSPFNIEYKIILLSGEERIVHEQGEVTFDPNHKPIRMRGTIQDVTRQKRIEEKIKRLANAVDSSNDAIITESVDGIIESWNKGAEQIYGYLYEEVIGKNVSILEPDNLKGEIKQLIEKTRYGEQIQRYETLRLKNDDTVINASVTLSPVHDASGNVVAISCITRDITGRKKAEEAFAAAEIARKKEIHHRIKNNLQVISSLLDLQADKFRSKMKVVSDDVITAFKESQDRVASMALIHEELYKGGSLHELHFAPYVNNLMKHLLKTYNVKDVDIDFKMNVVDDAFFNMDVAVPLGIVINELVSNSFKYAFKGRNDGEIEITLSRNGSTSINTNFVLTVSDDGIGVAENLKIEDLDSLGMQLVVSLIEQLDGTLDLKRNDGTKFIVQFPINEN